MWKTFSKMQHNMSNKVPSLWLIFAVLATLLVGCQPDIIEEQEPPQEQVTPPDTSEMMLDGACYLLDLPHKTAKVL